MKSLKKRVTLLLFDADGVLIKPLGYERALIDTLNRFTDFFGIEQANLTHDEIAFFESRGITNEWLSGAIALCEYLKLLTEEYPQSIAGNLQTTMENARAARITLPRPDFTIVMERALRNAGPEIDETPVTIAGSIKGYTPMLAHHLIDEVLLDVRPPAPFSTLFQNHTLGSVAFEQTYGTQAPFQLPAYLATLDQSNVKEETLAILSAFFRKNDTGMAIYTARPSLPPYDLTGEELATLNTREFPPEGDMVKDLVGLPEHMPLISGGRMSWLAIRDGLHPGVYIKPSPVHGLSTIAAAYLKEEKKALLAASALWNKGIMDEPFNQLIEMDISLIVFEDSPVGLYAMNKAVEYLEEKGASIQFTRIGITKAPEKRARLQEVADVIYDDINEAVRSVIPL